MLGLMMDRPLLTTEILKHAARNFHRTEIVTRTVEGPFHRYTIKDSALRIQKLANALLDLGVKPGDRVGVMGWNTHRQFELYYAVGGIGAVLHTVNPRLGPENAQFVINHAEDAFLFYDLTFEPLIAMMRPHLKSVRSYCALTDKEHADQAAPDTLVYEDVLASGKDELEWPDFDENTAVAMCYTSGTTGLPKGVVYSHRALVLQSFAAGLPTAMNVQEGESFLPVVPMFHVNAWNAPYTSLMVGLKQVFPGPRLDGEGLFESLENEDVTYSAGVPTVWLGLLDYMEKSGKLLPKLKTLMSGGAALTEKIVRGFAKYDIRVVQGWGMTEISPIGATNVLPPHLAELPLDERLPHQLKAGRSLPFVDMRLVNAGGQVLPHDGKAEGHLQVRGPWVVKDYYKAESATLTDDGWFDTGDIGIIDGEGFLRITDRSKDVIKTGGEWVSSLEIEDAALTHPGVAQAAVIGVPHPKWQERPLLIVVKAQGENPDAEDIRDHVASRVDKIAVPDAVEFLPSLPLGATGKILKTELRKIFKDFELSA
ncbi:MAG: long-chain fatty acid--CoA ligase [Pseudomonadota bacterium]